MYASICSDVIVGGVRVCGGGGPCGGDHPPGGVFGKGGVGKSPSCPIGSNGGCGVQGFWFISYAGAGTPRNAASELKRELGFAVMGLYVINGGVPH